VKTPSCCDKIPPEQYVHGQRRIKQHAWEDWGLDYRHLICGHDHVCRIYVCTRPLRPAQGGGMCGKEKHVPFMEQP
jgi:hypothetical protein